MIDKNTAKLNYKLSHRPMGVFQIRNKTNDRVFVDSSTNIPGKVNRHRFALNLGSHASKSLQTEWNELGESAFEFETIEPVDVVVEMVEQQRIQDFSGDKGQARKALHDAWGLFGRFARRSFVA